MTDIIEGEIVEVKDLVTVIKETGVAKTMAGTLQESFNGFFDDAKKLESEAKKIKITSADQVDDMKKARELRLSAKAIRVNAEKVKAQMKEGIIRDGRAIDGIYNVIVALTKPVEIYLENQEKYVERLIELEQEKVEAQRIAELSQYMENISYYDLKNMDEEGYQQLLTGAKAAKEASVAAEKAAEADRIEFEKKEATLLQRRALLAPFQDFVSEDFELTIETTETELNSALSFATKAKSKWLDEQDKIRKENEQLKSDRIKKDKEAEDERIRLQKIADKAQEDADKLQAEADAKAAKEAEATRLTNEKDEADKKAAARLEKEKAYVDWLTTNGVNDKTKPLFHLEKSEGEVKLYKLVSTFKIEE